MLPLSVSDSSLGTGGEVPPALRRRTAARTRTCFAAVHGVVAISLEDRFVGLADDTLPAEMDFLVERLAGH